MPPDRSCTPVVEPLAIAKQARFQPASEPFAQPVVPIAGLVLSW
jgi:hypothetical protein